MNNDNGNNGKNFVTVVVLNDGQTFTEISGCSICVVPLENYYEVLESEGDARHLEPVVEISLDNMTPPMDYEDHIAFENDNEDNNSPCVTTEDKTASEMLFHELAANNGTKRDIVDRLMLKPPLHTITNADFCEAAQEIRDLRKAVNDLTAWSEGVEGDNDTLRKEIARLREERDAARRDFCNGAYDDPHLVARERGWDCFKEESK